MKTLNVLILYYMCIIRVLYYIILVIIIYNYM